MSIHVMNKVWLVEADKMIAPTRLVLLALADSATDAGECFPSERYLAWKTGLSERQVRRHLGVLADGGWLHKQRQRKIHGRNEHVIDIAKLDAESKQQWQDVAAPLRTRATGVTGHRRPKSTGHGRPSLRTRATGDMVTHQGTVSEEPSTTTPSSSKSNEFEGPCARCDEPVKAGLGILIGKKPAHRTEELCEAAVSKKKSRSKSPSAYDKDVNVGAGFKETGWKR